MFLYLLFSSYSLQEPEGVVELNRVLFRRYVETRESYQPWLVAFTRNGSKKCSRCEPILEEVAAKSYGYLFVGKVDQDKEPLLAMDYGVTRNWTVFLFNKDGHTKITFPCDSQKYYRLLIDNLPTDVLDADPTWIESAKKKFSVILLTSRFKVPYIWRAIGGYFKQKGLRVGLITEQEYIDKYNVKRLPTILYINSTGQYSIPSVQDYKTLRSYVSLTFNNKPLPVKPNIQRFFLTKQYKDECKKGLICVVHASRSIDPRFALKETRFSDDRVRFFSGFSDLPYKFIKEGEIWIFNGEGDSLVPVDGIHDLDEMLKFVLRGTIKWTPLSEYNSDEL